MALNIALCDDIMGMIGHTVKARRGMAECLKKIETGFDVLEPHWVSVQNGHFQNLITGEIIDRFTSVTFWGDDDEEEGTVLSNFLDRKSKLRSCDRLKIPTTREEYKESILAKWSRDYQWIDEFEWDELESESEDEEDMVLD